jgi:hypothetical protein
LVPNLDGEVLLDVRGFGLLGTELENIDITEMF